MRDLIVLCPDIAWEQTLKAVLARHKNLRLPRPLDFYVFRAPGQTDGGVRRNGVALLRSYHKAFHRTILILDRDGCGDDRSARVIQQELDESLSHQWGQNGRAVVIDPEIEAWIIGGHTHFSVVNGLAAVGVREWLTDNGFWRKGENKPFQPKKAINQRELQNNR
jgi:hypothetical protein